MTAWTARSTHTRAYTGRRTAHLTRRGRVVVVLGLLALLLAAFSVIQARSDASTTTAPVVQPIQTTVHEGDTLWSVARRIVPDNDPREVVGQIRELNGLQGSTLQVGQQLLVPRAA